jgi:YD repeat-containing protein
MTYDRYGNRTAESVTSGSGPSNSVSVSASTNQITGMGSASFYYDSNGNQTQDDLYTYKYDAENRMVEMDNIGGGTVATYAFDGHSLRVVKVWGAGRTFSIFAGSQLISEFDDAASNAYSSGTTPASAGSVDMLGTGRVLRDRQGGVRGVFW